MYSLCYIFSACKDERAMADMNSSIGRYALVSFMYAEWAYKTLDRFVQSRFAAHLHTV